MSVAKRDLVIKMKRSYECISLSRRLCDLTDQIPSDCKVSFFGVTPTYGQ